MASKAKKSVILIRALRLGLGNFLPNQVVMRCFKAFAWNRDRVTRKKVQPRLLDLHSTPKTSFKSRAKKIVIHPKQTADSDLDMNLHKNPSFRVPNKGLFTIRTAGFTVMSKSII